MQNAFDMKYCVKIRQNHNRFNPNKLLNLLKHLSASVNDSRD